MTNSGFEPPNLAAANLPRLIRQLALPAIAGLSINALHHVANILYLGWIGSQAVSAVSSALPLLILMGALGEGLGVGTGSYISRLLGAKHEEEADRTATVGVALALGIGLAVSLILAFHLDATLSLFGITPAAFPLAKGYMQIVTISYPLLLLQIFGDFVAISEGNTRFSMWTLIGSFALNMVLDPVFIFVFKLGVQGAALATLCAQVAAVTAYGVYFIKKLGAVTIRLHYFTPKWSIIREILLIGSPAALATALTALAFALVYSSAARHGDAAVAGIGIALRLFSLGALPVAGFCLGARSVLGYAWGAQDYERVLNALSFMLRVASAFCFAYAVVMLSFAGSIAKLFAGDAETHSFATQALTVIFAVFPFFGLQTVMMNYLLARGKAQLALLLLLAPQGYFLIPGLLTLPRIWGFTGLVAAPLIAGVLTALLAGGLLISQMAQLRRHASRQPAYVEPLSTAEGAV